MARETMERDIRMFRRSESLESSRYKLGAMSLLPYDDAIRVLWNLNITYIVLTRDLGNLCSISGSYPPGPMSLASADREKTREKIGDCKIFVLQSRQF